MQDDLHASRDKSLEVNDIITIPNSTETSNTTTVLVTVKTLEETRIFYPPKRELPLTIIIAAPAAAVGIALFLCILYNWHACQLNRQAKRLVINIYVSHDDMSEVSDIPNIAMPMKIVPSPLNTRRKSTLSVPSLSVPGAIQSKRGSRALADQEIVSHALSSRRHSTFIL